MRNWFINHYGMRLLQNELETEHINKFNARLEKNKYITDLQVKNYTLDNAKMLKLYNNVILYINSLIDERQEAHTELMQKITRAKIKQIFETKKEVKTEIKKATRTAPKVKK